MPHSVTQSTYRPVVASLTLIIATQEHSCPVAPDSRKVKLKRVDAGVRVSCLSPLADCCRISLVAYEAAAGVDVRANLFSRRRLRSHELDVREVSGSTLLETLDERLLQLQSQKQYGER